MSSGYYYFEQYIFLIKFNCENLTKYYLETKLIPLYIFLLINFE